MRTARLLAQPQPVELGGECDDLVAALQPGRCRHPVRQPGGDREDLTLRPDFDPLPLPVVGFVGASGSGKTTLITAVLPALASAGLRVAVLKHAHCGFEMDRPGKDSYRVREAGASQVLVASRHRWALLTELGDDFEEPPFRELLDCFHHDRLDAVLVEGFAGERYPKIEVYRPALAQPPRCWPADPCVIAVATDADLAVAAPVRRLDLGAPHEATAFLLDHLTSQLHLELSTGSTA